MLINKSTNGQRVSIRLALVARGILILSYVYMHIHFKNSGLKQIKPVVNSGWWESMMYFILICLLKFSEITVNKPQKNSLGDDTKNHISQSVQYRAECFHLLCRCYTTHLWESWYYVHFTTVKTKAQRDYISWSMLCILGKRRA